MTTKAKMASRTIDEIPDADLARMVRESIYAKNTRFGRDKNSARFLLVVAVPYGLDDEVSNLSEAIDAFVGLFQADDWEERLFQVYDHMAEGSQFYQMAKENLLDEIAD